MTQYRSYIGKSMMYQTDPQPQQLSKIYSRVPANSIHKGSKNISILGRIHIYYPTKRMFTLYTNQQPQPTPVQCVLIKPQQSQQSNNNNNGMSEELLKKGVIVQVRGFGIDNKKVTVQEFNVFKGDIDLKMYNQVLELMCKNYANLFMPN